MLLSELEERGRRFKLALRAGIPILVLVGLIAYATFLKSDSIKFTTTNWILLAAIVFISIYFIYFLLEQDSKETLLDKETHGFNQMAFENRLKRSESKTIALLAIDNLQLINENYGVLKTNSILFDIMQRLNRNLISNGLKNALIGRRSGAHFLIAINSNEKELQNSLKSFIATNNNINSIDISYRYAIVTYKNEKLKDAVKYLKEELDNEEDKKTQKENDEIQNMDALVKLEGEISKAIENKKLFFMFKPLQNASNNEIDIYQISVKLKTEESDEILPRVFLPIINKLGLGREYDYMIIECMTKILPLIDDNISLAFNISPFSIRNKKFQDKVFSLLDDANINASRLIIELYEKKVHHDLSQYFKALGYFRSKNIRISLDNFGSSSASMEYIKLFKFDLVQFDRDYVTKLDKKAIYEMLNSFIGVSKNLGIITVAKWVDNNEQKNKLKEMGIDYLQGFGIGKEISEKDLIKKYN